MNQQLVTSCFLNQVLILKTSYDYINFISEKASLTLMLLLAVFNQTRFFTLEIQVFRFDDQDVRKNKKEVKPQEYKMFSYNQKNKNEWFSKRSCTVNILVPLSCTYRNDIFLLLLV